MGLIDRVVRSITVLYLLLLRWWPEDRERWIDVIVLEKRNDVNVRQGEMSTRILLLDDGQGRYRAMWVTILFGEEETSELMKPLTSSCDVLYTVHSPIHIQGISSQIFSYFFFSLLLSYIYLFYWRNRDRSSRNPARHWVALLPRNCYTTPAWALLPPGLRTSRCAVGTSSKELTMHALVGQSLIYQR